MGMRVDRDRVLILILGALMAIGPLSIDYCRPSFPRTAASFSASPARVELSLASFFIGLAACGRSVALQGPGAQAGAASAWLGTLPFSLAACSAWLVSWLHDGSALAMTTVVGGCGVASLAAYRAVCHTGVASKDSTGCSGTFGVRTPVRLSDYEAAP